MTTQHHLAQVNIALPREPIDSPLLADFVAALDPINRIAEQSPGFVWRLKTEEGDATGVGWPADDRILVNMSVWESLEALGDYVYRSGHVEIMRQRRKWFEAMELYMALWWIPRGHLPTVGEADERLRHLVEHGPTPLAFSFRQSFPPPGARRAGTDRPDDRCPGP